MRLPYASGAMVRVLARSLCLGRSVRRLLPATSADDSPVRPAADDRPSVIRSADDRTAVIGSAISVIWSADDYTAVIGCAMADDGPVGSTAHDGSTVGPRRTT